MRRVTLFVSFFLQRLDTATSLDKLVRLRGRSDNEETLRGSMSTISYMRWNRCARNRAARFDRQPSLLELTLEDKKAVRWSCMVTSSGTSGTVPSSAAIKMKAIHWNNMNNQSRVARLYPPTRSSYMKQIWKKIAVVGSKTTVNIRVVRNSSLVWMRMKCLRGCK